MNMKQRQPSIIAAAVGLLALAAAAQLYAVVVGVTAVAYAQTVQQKNPAIQQEFNGTRAQVLMFEQMFGVDFLGAQFYENGSGILNFRNEEGGNFTVKGNFIGLDAVTAENGYRWEENGTIYAKDGKELVVVPD